MTNPSPLLSIDAMGSLASTVQSLPWAAHALAAGMLGAGLVLWLLGRRVLRPMFGLIGALTGAGTGFLLEPVTGVQTVAGFPAPFVGLGIGALFGLILGLILFRFAVAISTALVLGLAGVLVSATYLNLAPGVPTPGETATSPDVAALRQKIEEHTKVLMETPVEDATQPGAPPPTMEARIGNFVTALAGEFRAAWDQFPARHQLIIGAAGATGLGAGFLLGLAMPKRSSAVVTSMLGPAIWIPSAVWLAHALDAPGRQWLERGPMSWLVIWIAVSAVGLALQLTSMCPRKAPEPAESK